MFTDKIFASALGVQSPWHIAGNEFEPNRLQLSARVDFEDQSNGGPPAARVVIVHAEHYVQFGPSCAVAGLDFDVAAIVDIARIISQRDGCSSVTADMQS